MKECPKCKGLALYDDTETLCPYCNSVLVPYVRRNRRAGSDNRYAANDPIRPNLCPNSANRSENPVFERYSKGKYFFRGTVVSITPTSYFEGNGRKWFNSVFKGQPYQTGDAVCENVIRIEEFSQSRLPEKARNITYYGELLELNVGDDVSIVAVKKKNKLIVQKLYIHDTDSNVRVHKLLSPAAIRFLTLVVIGLLLLIISSVVTFFTSGGVENVLSAVVGGMVSVILKLISIFSPIIILIFIFRLFFHKH